MKAVLADAGAILDSFVVAALGAALGGAWWLAKRWINRRSNERRHLTLLSEELLVTWEALDGAAAFHVPVSPEAVQTSYYHSHRDEIAGSVKPRRRERIRRAYVAIDAAAQVQDFEAGRIATEVARDACIDALRACGQPTPMTLWDKMDQAQEEYERSSLEMIRASRDFKRISEHMTKRLAEGQNKLSPSSIRLVNWIDDELDAGRSVAEVAESLYQRIGHQVSDKDLKALEELILQRAREARRRGPASEGR